MRHELVPGNTETATIQQRHNYVHVSDICDNIVRSFMKTQLSAFRASSVIHMIAINLLVTIQVPVSIIIKKFYTAILETVRICLCWRWSSSAGTSLQRHRCSQDASRSTSSPTLNTWRQQTHAKMGSVQKDVRKHGIVLQCNLQPTMLKLGI